MSDDEDDVCLHKGVQVPNGPYLINDRSGPFC